jgi:phosphoribosylamine-glycine ligase
VDKRVLVLGGGLLQIPLMIKARAEGFKVCLADYLKDPPGKKYCDDFRQISTFSVDDNCRYALEKGINFVMTVGTDQPVLTAAAVSEKLNLPHPITAGQGKMVTHKLFMKEQMRIKGVPSPKYLIYTDFTEFDLTSLNYPLVMKPADSQGQRGIFVLHGREKPGEVKRLFEASKGHSRTGTVVIEEYYPGEEITVNTWVKAGRAFNLLITDRLHFDDTVALGICKQQRYPSRSARGREEEIDRVVQKLVDAFGIQDGPLYIQAIAGSRGIQIVEFGYRIGGGFESETIPRITGVDILDLYFKLVTGGENLFRPEIIEEKAGIGSIFFMLARPGRIAAIKVPDEFKEWGKLFVRPGAELGEIENATSRVGCFSIYCNDAEEYRHRLTGFDSGVALFDRDGNDLLIHNIWE